MKEPAQNSEIKTQSYQSKEVAAGFSLRNQEQDRNLKVAATILSCILLPPFVIACFRG